MTTTAYFKPTPQEHAFWRYVSLAMQTGGFTLPENVYYAEQPAPSPGPLFVTITPISDTGYGMGWRGTGIDPDTSEIKDFHEQVHYATFSVTANGESTRSAHAAMVKLSQYYRLGKIVEFNEANGIKIIGDSAIQNVTIGDRNQWLSRYNATYEITYTTVDSVSQDALTEMVLTTEIETD